jgi:hypothetical protein
VLPRVEAAAFGRLSSISEVVAQELLAHARKLSLRGKLRIGILENREWTTGITEMPSLARYLEQRGIACTIGDPRELTLHRGGWRLRGEPVDLLYRNMELADLVALETPRRKLAAVRQAFTDDRVVSGLAGDFDHKSLFEVLTTRPTRAWVEPKARAYLRKHLLWTRLLRHCDSEDKDGEAIDLVRYVRAHKRSLVIKPNRACGGQDVILGPAHSDKAWARAVERALKERGEWVVQSFHVGTRKRFPSLRGRGVSTCFVTYGVVSTPRGFGVVGRACDRPVVNVSRGGGLVALFTAREK